ncbi:hypothetical protein C6V83_18085 [Gordonia iterans]|uniref:Uncharacterized protein n=1 Tax=Gordonia iterans TaxID=1004901 RepID=A0A2S0KJM0_9ACTN|nr:hypothetical protein [Gordonia iterans]AVM01888.1 hypothetical protein C6V83_18085 [Gordonia iterans]
MPNTVWPSVHASRMRITKLNACGVPITSPLNKSLLVTDGIVKINFAPEYEDGEETLRKNGSGKICVNHEDPPQLKNVGVEIEFCGIDPEAWSLITGQDLVLDYLGNAVGQSMGSDPIDANFAIEGWSDVPGVACESGEPGYGYWLVPFVGNGRVGDMELAVGGAEFTVSAKTKPGTGWGAGPYSVVRDVDENDAPIAVPLLVPLTKSKHFHFEMTPVAPPEPTEGAVLLTPYTP